MINIYTAGEAKAAADLFYGPLSQIFDYIREKAKDGLYVLSVSGVELNAKQIEILKNAGYDVEQTLNEHDQHVYLIGWSQ